MLISSKDWQPLSLPKRDVISSLNRCRTTEKGVCSGCHSLAQGCSLNPVWRAELKGDNKSRVQGSSDSIPKVPKKPSVVQLVCKRGTPGVPEWKAAQGIHRGKTLLAGIIDMALFFLELWVVEWGLKVDYSRMAKPKRSMKISFFLLMLLQNKLYHAQKSIF